LPVGQKLLLHGRLYELEGYNDISAAFYRKAVEINPHSEAAERLEQQ